MPAHHPVRVRRGVVAAAWLALTLARPLHAQADPAGSPLILTPEHYFASAQAWVRDVEAASLDPTLSHILEAGREAAQRGDWAAAATAVQNVGRTNPPTALQPLLRALVASGAGDTEAHLQHLAEAAPLLVAGGHVTLAVDTWRYLALSAAGRRDHDAAMRFLGRAAIADPHHAGVQYLLGQFAWDAGRRSEAIAAFERATTLAPQEPQAWAALARAYARAGRAADAAVAGNQVLQLAPGWIEYRIEAAAWLLDQNEPEAAFNLLLPFAGHARDFPVMREVMQRAAQRMGGAAVLSKEVERLRQAGGTADEWAAVAQRLSKAGALEEAAAAYRAALALEPARGDLGFLLGGVLGLMRDVDGAVAAYEQAIANDYGMVLSTFNLGLMHHAREDYDAAIAAFDRSLDAGGVRSYVLALRAKSKWRAGRLEDALADLNESILIDPQGDMAWPIYGRVLLDLGLPEPARDAFVKALEVDPSAADARYWLGRAALGMDRPREAFQTLRAEFGQGGRSPDVAYWTGVAAQRLGALDQARFAFETALFHARGSPEAWLRLGELAQRRGDLASAGATFARARDLGLDGATLHLRMGELAMARDDLAAAETALAKAVERDPALTDAWRRLGAVQAERGNTAAARRSFAHAYGRDRMAWFFQRSLSRFFIGVLAIGGFLVVVIVGARVRARPDYSWYPLFLGRVDLAAVLMLGLLCPIVLMVVAQRLVYASFELQRLANRQAAGFNAILAFRDGLFLGVIPLLYVWWRRKWAWPALPDGRRLLAGALWGALGFMIFAAPGVVARLLESDVMGQGLFPRGRNLFNATPQSLIASVLGIGIVSSAVQEIFYRGIVYRRSRDQVGWVLAALLSAFLFAAFHFQPANFWWYFGFGVLAAFLYERAKTLAAPVVMHMLYNVVQVII